MFELETMTKARVLDVRTLTSKDRKPDDKPGAQVLMRAQLSSDVLAMFDGFLPGMLYRKAKTDKKGQDKIEGMESSELTSIGDHVKRLPWAYEQTGCDLVIDRGMGGRSNISLSDCKVHRVSFVPQQGGSVTVHWTVDAPALTDDTRGKLSGMKSTDIELTIALPEVQQDDLTETKPARAGKAAAEKAAPAQKDATEQFIERHAPKAQPGAH